MFRFCIALLLLISLWPSPAAAGERAVEPDLIVAVKADYPGGAFRSTGGWELLQLATEISPGSARGNGGRSPGLGDAGLADRALSFRSTPIARVVDVRLGAGVLFLRHEHLPYYATAPPFSR